MTIDRRTLLKLTGLAGGLKIAGVQWALASTEEWRHGLSLFDDVKYPANFKHFDYVNPNAPKGGRVRLFAIGSFDSLNPYTFKGVTASSISRTASDLTTPSFDEASTAYGLVAEAVKHPADFASVTYRLRTAARFHDGQAITPEDAIWSMEALKKSHPFFAFYYKDIVAAEQTGEHEVTFRFNAPGNRELPHIAGQLPVLPKHWWTGKDGEGKQRDITQTSLEAPLGSGPYRVHDVQPGRSITLKRVPDYWGKDLAVNAGKDNFDEITTLYFRDQTVALEAFKGDQYDWRRETSSKDWATGYTFPAVDQGRVIREEITTRQGDGMQAFVFNTRHKKFADARTRLAFNFAFDFEWSNANLFYGQYQRTNSYFSNSELASSGLPRGAELDILNPLRDQVPDEVFSQPFTNPVNESSQDRRKNLRRAAQLLNQAGWTTGDGHVLKNADGDQLAVEFLLVSPQFERIVLPYVKNLERLGIAAKVRTVDSAQYQRRLQTFEFDIIVAGWGQSLSPGNEQRDFFGTEAASRDGSRNYVGIQNPAIDTLIDAVIFATDRAGLVAATHALDRVLLWNHYVVPMWHIPYERTARWDRFGRPDTLPDYAIGFPSIWWWDAERAAKTEKS